MLDEDLRPGKESIHKGICVRTESLWSSRWCSLHIGTYLTLLQVSYQTSLKPQQKVGRWHRRTSPTTIQAGFIRGRPSKLQRAKSSTFISQVIPPLPPLILPQIFLKDISIEYFKIFHYWSTICRFRSWASRSIWLRGNNRRRRFTPGTLQCRPKRQSPECDQQHRNCACSFPLWWGNCKEGLETGME